MAQGGKAAAVAVANEGTPEANLLVSNVAEGASLLDMESKVKFK